MTEEQTTFGWGAMMYTLPWHERIIRCATTDDGRDWRVLKDLSDATETEYTAQQRRVRDEHRWGQRYCYLTVPSPGGRQRALCIERGIVKGVLYGIHPRNS